MENTLVGILSSPFREALRWQLKYLLPGLAVLLLTFDPAFCQDTGQPAGTALKKLSIEELMDINVTSVSKRPEKLSEVASAIQVITQEDIHRSGATSLPEALRLASNLQVAQLNSYAWIISARGFNAVFSNKLLVMIDGRTVYSPLFAGVFWDVQSVLLEDVDRIEVISGPGGTLWGENAVNGVINVITKKASDTQGLYASASVGTMLRKSGALRYGGHIGSRLSYRLYAQHSDRDYTLLQDGSDNSDSWWLSQTGVRIDWDPSETDNVMVQGNAYTGLQHNNEPKLSTVDGQNILGRWAHTFEGGSNLNVQAYYDRTWRRDIPSTISDQLETYDLDFQHHFSLLKRHSILWGGGFRLMHNRSQHSTVFVGILPPVRDMKLFSSFIQDEITLIPARLRFIAGTKIQHNDFSGFEIQPSGRLAWTASGYTLWGAVSRAIRAPSRIDVDYFIPTFPLPENIPHVAGGPNFSSENVTAWEIGSRVQLSSALSLSLAAFINRYNDLYSVEALPGTQIYQIQNGTEGKSRGVEFSGSYQVLRSWRLRGGYTYFYKELSNKPGHVYDFSPLGNDAENQFLLHSMLDLPANFQVDITLRYMDKLPKPHIPDYFTFDARVAWEYDKWEVAFVAQNAWEDRHREVLFVIPRGYYAKIGFRL